MLDLCPRQMVIGRPRLGGGKTGIFFERRRNVFINMSIFELAFLENVLEVKKC